jgi:hypothetical protein
MRFLPALSYLLMLTHACCVRAAHPVERANVVLSQACFGLSAPHDRLALADSFPMDDVTPAKLFSLFEPLRAWGYHGTVVYFTSRSDNGVPLVAPTADGASVQAGGVPLHDFLPRAWMLPRSATMAVEADYGARVRADKMPFAVTLRGPSGETVVDWSQHPWERCVADGFASPPQTLQVPYGGGRLATVHVQFGYLKDDEDSGIYLHRHKRFAKVEPHVHRMDSADAGELRQRMAVTTAFQHKGAYDAMCRIYNGTPPLSMGQLRQRTASELQRIFGRYQITLVSCHDLAWQEGKEAFIQNALYHAVLAAVRLRSAQYALKHPWPEEYAAKAREASAAQALITRKAKAHAPAESKKKHAAAAAADDDDDDDEAGRACPTPLRRLAALLARRRGSCARAAWRRQEARRRRRIRWSGTQNAWPRSPRARSARRAHPSQARRRWLPSRRSWRA